MKLVDVIILVFSAVLLMVGVHQGITLGWDFAYFFFMFSVGLLFLYSYRRQKRLAAEKEEETKGPAKRRVRRR